MKKFLILIAALCLLLTACGQAAPEASPDAAAASDAAQTAGILSNFSTTDLDGNSGSAPNYFNDRQMIYDKTSYAIDMGLGGMMIWHMACDDTQNLEKSLTGAMKQAIEDRNAL